MKPGVFQPHYPKLHRTGRISCVILLWFAIVQAHGVAQGQGESADAFIDKWVAEQKRKVEEYRRQMEQQGKQNGQKDTSQDDRSNASGLPTESSALDAGFQRIRRNLELDVAREKRYGPRLVNSIGMVLVPIPPGEFTMRPPELPHDLEVPWRKRGESSVQVRLTRPFYLGAYEVTEAQYGRLGFRSTAPYGDDHLWSGMWNREGDPAHYVSWESAVAFCAKLTELPEEKAAGRTYRLPTEAEWEYAARAGTTSPFCFGTEANFAENSANWRTVPRNRFVDTPRSWTLVGSYRPNDFGLFDMHGNVEEWCSDWYGSYPAGPLVDPTGPTTGTTRVVRGGSFEHYYLNATSGSRDSIAPDKRRITVGFRVVCEVRAAIDRETKQ